MLEALGRGLKCIAFNLLFSYNNLIIDCIVEICVDSAEHTLFISDKSLDHEYFSRAVVAYLRTILSRLAIHAYFHSSITPTKYKVCCFLIINFSVSMAILLTHALKAAGNIQNIPTY